MIDYAARCTHAEEFTSEDEVLASARERAGELGLTTVSAATGALLRLLTLAMGATNVVEVGTGTGVGSLWLLRGMPMEGVLTTIDPEAENIRAAKKAFAAAGVRQTRARTITGEPLDVMSRLTIGVYDMVVLDVEPVELEAYISSALTLLRPGGVLIINEALWHGRVADPARRDLATVAMRTTCKRLRDELTPVCALVPLGGGLLFAAKPLDN